MAKNRLTIEQLRVELSHAPQTIVGELLGLSRVTVNQRVKMGEFEDAGGGRVNAFTAGETERKRQRAGVVSIESARLRRAQADRAEIENRARRGELIELAEYEESNKAAASLLVQMLDALPARVRPRIDTQTTPAGIARLIESEIREIRTELADQFAQLAGIAPMGSDPPTGPKPNARRMGGRKSKAPARKRRSRSL